MPHDFYDEMRRDSAERMNRRQAREAERKRARRKLEKLVLAVLGAFLISLAAGVTVHAATRSKASAAAAKRAPKSTPAASPTVAETASDLATSASESLSDTPPATVAEPVVEEEPKVQPKREAPQPKPAAKPQPKPAPKATSAQLVRIAIGAAGYEPSVVRVDAGRKVRVTVGKGEGCAAGFEMPGLGISKDNSNGPVTFTLPALEPGTYQYTCGMGMVSGQLIAR